jgi:hypothetical protein
MRRLAVALINALAILLALIVFQQTSPAQLDSWEQINRIKAGQKVRVKLFSGETLNGKLEYWSTDRITLKLLDAGGPRSLAKAEVAEVVTLGMSRRGKALIGFLAGGSTGVTAMAIDCAGHPAGEVCGQGSDGVVVFALTGAIGAAIGAMFAAVEDPFNN